jgi:hypothetical protein
MPQASRIGSVVLFVVLAISTVLTIVLFADYLSRREQLQTAAFNAAQTQAVAASEQIGSAFEELMTIADSLATELSEGRLAYTDIRTRMLEIVGNRPDIDGLAITFQPFVYDPDIRLFQTYVYRNETGRFDVLEGATYDYTQAPGESSNNTAWYYNTINEGAQWLEPFFATGAQEILVEYGVPFYPVSADPAG